MKRSGASNQHRVSRVERVEAVSGVWGLVRRIASAAGIAIAAVVLLATTLYSGDEPGSVYVPPHLEGDRVVPGASKQAPP